MRLIPFLGKRSLLLFTAWAVGGALTAPLPASPEPEHRLYASGAFPPGTFYRPAELASLEGQTFDPEATPSYLQGQFLLLPTTDGSELFADFIPGDPAGDGFEFGRLLLRVRWFGNRPPALTPNKILHATQTDPLIVRSVKATSDGKNFIVETECWSLP